MQYIFFGKESKHISIQSQKGNSKIPNIFNQEDGNQFLTEVWVVLSLVVIGMAVKHVVMALLKRKKQPALFDNLYKKNSILFVVAMFLSFDTIHQSWQFDPRFLSLEDLYSSGFDLSALLFGVHLGKSKLYILFNHNQRVMFVLCFYRYSIC